MGMSGTPENGTSKSIKTSYIGRVTSKLDITRVLLLRYQRPRLLNATLVQGVLNGFFSPATAADGNPVPVNLLVTGTVPAGSGLSSSAAMVVASTLAFLSVNNKLEGVTKRALVEMAVENEKRVGVNSGGYSLPFPERTW